MAKLLYLAKRARPDIGTAIAFLTTRVINPNSDDWNKLVRCIRYLGSTPNLTLTLSANNVPLCKWWVDASYAVHPDCRSQTGSMMTLGKGAILSSSVKQKLNTRSSTESELVAVDDASSQIFWTNNFLEEQQYEMKGTVLYQDNRSAILLATNGHFSRGKRSKHISVRYFFIKDRVEKGEIDIQWCPTDDMSADFFTKPLQGAQFIKFQRCILNLSP